MQQLWHAGQISDELEFSMVRTGIGKRRFGIARDVPIGEFEHEPINFLSLTG
jgi:hypothetical protein